jgi:hypothetical protein
MPFERAIRNDVAQDYNLIISITQALLDQICPR